MLQRRYSIYVILILGVGCLEISCAEDKINLNKGTLLLLVAYRKKYDMPILDVNSQIYNIKNEAGYKTANEAEEDEEGRNYGKKLDAGAPFDRIGENVEEVKSPNLMIEENINNPFNAVSNLHWKDNNGKGTDSRRKRDTRIRRNRHKFRPSPLLSGG